MVAGPAEKLYVRLYFMDRSSSILPKMAGAPDRASIVHFHKIINSKIKNFQRFRKTFSTSKKQFVPRSFSAEIAVPAFFFTMFLMKTSAQKSTASR